MAIAALKYYEPFLVITGMALGWDTKVAEACLELGVPFVAAIPFVGQEAKWADWDVLNYNEILEQAKEKVIVCEGSFAVWKLQKRNEWIVDNSEGLLALFSGSKSGTKNCIDYANKKNKFVVNAWKSWIKYK